MFVETFEEGINTSSQGLRGPLGWPGVLSVSLGDRQAVGAVVVVGVVLVVVVPLLLLLLLLLGVCYQ